eukprot:2280075-Prymnesium_polylepis.2
MLLSTRSHAASDTIHAQRPFSGANATMRCAPRSLSCGGERRGVDSDSMRKYASEDLPAGCEFECHPQHLVACRSDEWHADGRQRKRRFALSTDEHAHGLLD